MKLHQNAWEEGGTGERKTCIAGEDEFTEIAAPITA